MDVIERVARLSQGAAQRLQVRSALNPLLWLSVTTGLLCFNFAYLFREAAFVRNLLVIVGCLPAAVTCCIAVYFAVKKPDKLQSEDYQIRQQTLQVIEQKAGTIKVEPAALHAILDSAARRIESGEVVE